MRIMICSLYIANVYIRTSYSTVRRRLDECGSRKAGGRRRAPMYYRFKLYIFFSFGFNHRTQLPRDQDYQIKIDIDFF